MIEVLIGDSRRLIHGLKDKSIDCVVTSPPYWGLRDYKTEPIIFDGLPDCEHDFSIKIRRNNDKSGGYGNVDDGLASKTCNAQDSARFGEPTQLCSLCGAWRGQLGLEPTPELFIKHLLDFFDDVKLKLKDEGNCFVNLGDTYSGSGCGTNDYRTEASKSINGIGKNVVLYKTNGIAQKFKGLPAKCLCMIPQRFAWGMIERGWILRNEIIWAKPNHMPESVTDRLTKAHEVIYHFVKQGKYYYNLDAIREPWVNRENDIKRAKNKELRYHGKFGDGYDIANSRKDHLNATATGQPIGDPDKGKNPGDVWEITLQPYPESHFAVFPLELVRRPILAGCPVGGIVLDPFAGSGTVGSFCRHNERNAILFELNPDYKKLIEDRAMLLVPELSEWCSTKGNA